MLSGHSVGVGMRAPASDREVSREDAEVELAQESVSLAERLSYSQRSTSPSMLVDPSLVTYAAPSPCNNLAYSARVEHLRK